MTWRKWLVRGLVLLIAGGLTAGGLLYLRFTDSENVRALVIQKLTTQFRHTSVSLDTAYLRLLGGISLDELRLTRADDPEKNDWLYVPSAVIYHDKEQLLNGVLRIRKLELYRPRFHVIRNTNGSWNLDDVLTPVNLNEAIPTIVIKQGTIVVEDRDKGHAAIVEIKDVNLTLLNDPLPTINFAGSAASDLAGTLQVTGAWDRATSDTRLSLDAPAIPFGAALLERVASIAPELAGSTQVLEGQGKLHVEATYTSAQTAPWTYDVSLHVAHGRLGHERLPFTLEGVEADLRLTPGSLTLSRFDAHAGRTTVHASIHKMKLTEVPSWEQRFQQLEVRLEHLELTDALLQRLPQALQHLRSDFAPAGTLNATLIVGSEPDNGWHKHFVFQATDGRACVKEFPYAVDHVAGTILFDADNSHPDKIQIELTGLAGTRPIHIQGSMVGSRPEHQVDVQVWGEDVPIDRKLTDALVHLPPEYRKLANDLHPTGLVNFRAHILRDAQARKFLNEYLVNFHDATICYGGFPYLLDRVSGTLDIRPDYWEFRNFSGMHHGGTFEVRGHPERGASGDRVVLHLEGRNVLLDDDLLRAQRARQLQNVWRAFHPSGRVDFTCDVALNADKKQQVAVEDLEVPDALPDIELTVIPQGCSIQPEMFPYALTDLHGRIHYADHWLTLEGIQARHKESTFSLEKGFVALPPEGGYYVDLRNLQIHPLFPDDSLAHSLPGRLRTCWAELGIRDPVAAILWKFVLKQEADPARRPEIYWDGALGLSDATVKLGIPVEHVTGEFALRGIFLGDQLGNVVGNFCWKEFTVYHQPFHDVRGHVFVEKEHPEVLCIDGLSAGIYGGTLNGPIRVEFGPILRYEVDLFASEVQLEQFARQNFGANAQMSGLATARLYLSGQGSDVHSIKGSGSVDVPDGKIKELPPLLDLLKVLGLRPPDRTAFEEAHITFDIQGPQVQINRLNLLGNAISLRGQGNMGLDGDNINLDFHADWARLPEVLPDPAREILQGISNHLLTIKARGKVGDIKFTKEPVPWWMAPIRKAMEGG